jgi:hypothetical protein
MKLPPITHYWQVAMWLMDIPEQDVLHSEGKRDAISRENKLPASKLSSRQKG